MQCSNDQYYQQSIGTKIHVQKTIQKNLLHKRQDLRAVWAPMQADPKDFMPTIVAASQVCKRSSSSQAGGIDGFDWLDGRLRQIRAIQKWLSPRMGGRQHWLAAFITSALLFATVKGQTPNKNGIGRDQHVRASRPFLRSHFPRTGHSCCLYGGPRILYCIWFGLKSCALCFRC